VDGIYRCLGPWPFSMHRVECRCTPSPPNLRRSCCSDHRLSSWPSQSLVRTGASSGSLRQYGSLGHFLHAGFGVFNQVLCGLSLGGASPHHLLGAGRNSRDRGQPYPHKPQTGCPEAPVQKVATLKVEKLAKGHPGKGATGPYLQKWPTRYW
jgi:hypothetical protein